MEKRKPRKDFVLCAVIAAACAIGYGQEPTPEQVIRHEKLDVIVPDFPARGLILDIGGGGEGVIGRLKGPQVIAIDLLKRELEDAPAGPLLKIVMDGRDLKFLDGAFPTATVFFTFMYIAPPDHGQVLKEIHRVLAAGGRLLIWDVEFPRKTDPRQSVIQYPLHITLPNMAINTGYGVHLAEGQGMTHFIGLAEQAGFETVVQESRKGWFFLEFKKP